MASSPPEQQKGRDGSLTMLTVAIESLNLAKAITSIALAKAAFGSVSNLLAIIRVRPPSPYDNELRVDISPGYCYRRTRLRRYWAVLRKYMRVPPQRAGQETIE